jgi:hypothetical protein
LTFLGLCLSTLAQSPVEEKAAKNSSLQVLAPTFLEPPGDTDSDNISEEENISDDEEEPKNPLPYLENAKGWKCNEEECCRWDRSITDYFCAFQTCVNKWGKVKTLKGCESLSFLFGQAYSDLSILRPGPLQAWWQTHPYETTASIAAFGQVPWGEQLRGHLQLAYPLNACDYISLNEDIGNSIIVAMRGECSFAMKAHNAQLAGATMLIIVDNVYEDVEQRLIIDNSVEGLGKTIDIPSILLSKSAGDKLISSLQSNKSELSIIDIAYDFPLQNP